METQSHISIFTENAKDSLLHAFDHFFELRQDSSREWHHQKWIIVSMHGQYFVDLFDFFIGTGDFPCQ
jgi:hypothetical protein